MEETKFLEEYNNLKLKNNRTYEDFKNLFEKYNNLRLPCYIDNLFKNVFYIKSYAAKVISFFIDLDYEYIKENMILDNTVLKRVNLYHRGSICDVLIRVDDYTILLECNMRKSKELTDKNLHTFSGVSYNMVTSGDKVSNKKAIMLSFDNYDIYNENKHVYKSMIKEDVVGYIESENYIIYHINLDSIRNVLYNTDDIENLTEFERIIGFLVNMRKDIDEQFRKDEYIMEALENTELQMLDFGEILERSYYFYDQALFNKGRQEEKLSLAKEMLSSGEDIDKIVKFTKLSKDEIENLETKTYKSV